MNDPFDTSDISCPPSILISLRPLIVTLRMTGQRERAEIIGLALTRQRNLAYWANILNVARHWSGLS